MPNDPHDPMFPPLVEDHEEESFDQEIADGMVMIVRTCLVLLILLAGIVAYFLVRAGGAI